MKYFNFVYGLLVAVGLLLVAIAFALLVICGAAFVPTAAEACSAAIAVLFGVK
jgi:hypothetical protein